MWVNLGWLIISTIVKNLIRYAENAYFGESGKGPVKKEFVVQGILAKIEKRAEDRGWEITDEEMDKIQAALSDLIDIIVKRVFPKHAA